MAGCRAKRTRRGECSTNPTHRFSGGLGAVIYDPMTGRARHAAAEPPWDILLSSWRTDRKTYIAELETLAAVAVYTTYPEIVSGRKVNHFIDNTVALSALVHGYAGKPDLAKATNVFHMQLVGMRTSAYLDYVPSKANIADLPSRWAFDILEKELAGIPCPRSPDVLVVPSISQWKSPLESWLDVTEMYPDQSFPV